MKLQSPTIIKAIFIFNHIYLLEYMSIFLLGEQKLNVYGKTELIKVYILIWVCVYKKSICIFSKVSGQMNLAHINEFHSWA